MKRRIVFATGNENKMKEIRMILADLGMEIVSMREAGVDEEIVEDGMSFEENAEIKARAVSRVLMERQGAGTGPCPAPSAGDGLAGAVWPVLRGPSPAAYPADPAL